MIRRSIDLLFSALGLALVSILFAIIAVLIKLDSHGPIFFRQERAGRFGQPFMIWKFRTMADGRTNTGLGHRTAKDDDRITRVGQVLRSLSLDELPQLINVLRGEMSLIGPRPTLPEQVQRYTEEQRRRLDVRPGITSWAAVNGRNRITWDERIALDVWYVDNQSLWLDARIIARSFWVAFVTRDGVYPDHGPNDDFVSAHQRGQ